MAPEWRKTLVRTLVSTCLLQNLPPDVIRPMRGEDTHHESLGLDIVPDTFAMHSNGCRVGSCSITIACRHQVVEARLQRRLVVGPVPSSVSDLPAWVF